ncbi:calpain-A-like [Branchiostoma lanceolatum]|uniref:calpain-A-like n=1 Tax=Branchiostoma lanceolatum TaxID=7740 RepID=UPI003453A1F3
MGICYSTEVVRSTDDDGAPPEVGAGTTRRIIIKRYKDPFGRVVKEERIELDGDDDFPDFPEFNIGPKPRVEPQPRLRLQPAEPQPQPKPQPQPQPRRNLHKIQGPAWDNKKLQVQPPRGRSGSTISRDSGIVDEADDGMLKWREKEKLAPKPPEAPEQEETQPRDDLADEDDLGVTNYKRMKSQILAMGPGALYSDPEFPARPTSLFYSNQNIDPRIVWKRPQEIMGVTKPRLLVDGISRDDVIQGMLGDCWFLVSLAAICRDSALMEKVVPRDQYMWQEGEGEGSYVGMFHFKFWRYGKWVDTIVDDLLPTMSGQQPMYCRSNDPNEFWSALVEKAYAKLRGSYEALNGGQAIDALEDLTGGMAESYDLKKAPGNLYQIMRRAFKKRAFFTTSKKTTQALTQHGVTAQGLVGGHAYSITSVHIVHSNFGDFPLVRIRNPWGDGTEWTGDWSDSSPLWDRVPQHERDRIGFTDKDDGEFWMDFKDFCQHFTEVTICTIGPDFDADAVADVDREWHQANIKGFWEKGTSAGGCRNNIKAYASNPQFALRILEPDDYDPEIDPPEDQGKCKVVVALMQEHRRSQRHLGVRNLQIGIHVYKANKDPHERLNPKYFMYHRDVASSGSYINLREVFLRANLEPGDYVIVPSTFGAEEQGSFLIRIFTEKNIEVKPLRNQFNMYSYNCYVQDKW